MILSTEAGNRAAFGLTEQVHEPDARKRVHGPGERLGMDRCRAVLQRLQRAEVECIVVEQHLDDGGDDEHVRGPDVRERSPPSVVKHGKGDDDTPDADEARGCQIPAMWWNGEAERSGDPAKARTAGRGHRPAARSDPGGRARERRASRARRVQDRHERLGSRIEVEPASERPGTSSTAARAPFVVDLTGRVDELRLGEHDRGPEVVHTAGQLVDSEPRPERRQRSTRSRRADRESKGRCRRCDERRGGDTIGRAQSSSRSAAPASARGARHPTTRRHLRSPPVRRCPSIAQRPATTTSHHCRSRLAPAHESTWSPSGSCRTCDVARGRPRPRAARRTAVCSVARSISHGRMRWQSVHHAPVSGRAWGQRASPVRCGC